VYFTSKPLLQKSAFKYCLWNSSVLCRQLYFSDATKTFFTSQSNL